MIDIINDISYFLTMNTSGYSNQEYRKILFDIFLLKKNFIYWNSSNINIFYYLFY